jgi:hypothetical protein
MGVCFLYPFSTFKLSLVALSKASVVPLHKIPRYKICYCILRALTGATARIAKVGVLVGVLQV